MEQYCHVPHGGYQVTASYFLIKIFAVPPLPHMALGGGKIKGPSGTALPVSIFLVLLCTFTKMLGQCPECIRRN